MPIPQIFYLNAPSLGSATAIFYDAALTLCADDGFYSDGVITREQIGCSLLPQQTCPPCGTDCSVQFINSPFELTSGIFRLDVNTGTNPTDVGAIIVTFTPKVIPTGIAVTFNGSTHNLFSSQAFGLVGGTTAGLPSFIGDVGNVCADIVDNTLLLTTYSYDGTTWNGGADEFISIVFAQLYLTAGDPLKCVMVIPKTSTISNTLNIEIIEGCVNSPFGDGFDIAVSCPALLPAFTCSEQSEESEIRCALPLSQTCYFASVNGVPPFLGLYDWVFTDPYGETILADGYYRTNFVTSPNDTIQVANGIIIAITQTC